MLYVSDSYFNRLGMIGKFSYLLWRKRYSRHGEAELHVDATTKNIQLLQKGNILFRSDDNEAMYIYYRGFSDEGNNDQLIVKCFSLVKWLDRRLIWGIHQYNDTPENIIIDLITSSCIDPYNPDRVISQIQLSQPKGFGKKIEKQVSYKNLLDEVENTCNTHEIGIRSLFNGQELFIDLYEGTDRSVDQIENPRVTLSKEFANVLTRNYEDADNDYKNTVLVAGAGEGEERKVVSIEQGSGLDRRELYVDARDLQQDVGETPIPDEEYTATLLERGIEKLSENERHISFDCKLDVVSTNTVYGRDFFLGDVVTIRDIKLGITMNSRVVEVDEVYQNNKQTYVKVGKSIPTLVDKVRKMVR